ncbi:hypothetical protein BN1221_03769 [Brenneria goodwinii]|uniref:Uncharacterized protein n=1 Tax=Brenneria goodwinii TaxID=1109412 RepID=A0A0G4K005_9GAMM|nr:hypothetical protein BN1221_03769 [Brenneria goodwinii]
MGKMGFDDKKLPGEVFNVASATIRKDGGQGRHAIKNFREKF